MADILVSIVEDAQEIREGMRFVINQANGISCLSIFDNAEDAILGLSESPPDIAIVDIRLPGMTGIECIRRLKEAGSLIQFMVFTIYDNGDQLIEAMTAGAGGYLLKSSPPSKIIEAIEELQRGGAPMSTSIARKLVSTFHKPDKKHAQTLSVREMEVLHLLAQGLQYKEIGNKLYIATGTVRQHIHKIYEKLHVQNRTEALNKIYGRKH